MVDAGLEPTYEEKMRVPPPPPPPPPPWAAHADPESFVRGGGVVQLRQRFSLLFLVDERR